MKNCCYEFRKAQQYGTDNEGYGPLLGSHNGEWHMGCDLAPIEYCPWCGKPVTKPEGE